jgi:hypothetical protein
MACLAEKLYYQNRCGKWTILLVLLGMVLVSCAGPAMQGGGPSPAAGLAVQSGASLAVIGVRQDDTPSRSGKADSLREPRVGFGITSLLAESLFETGQFRLIEEKDIRQRDVLADLVKTYWIEARTPYTVEQLQRVAQQLGVALLAYGSVVYGGFSGRRWEIGPVSGAEQTLHLEVTACLYVASTRASLCRQGQGEARQEGVGVVYEFRGDRLDFAQNAVGRATKEAAVLAVRELIASLTFLP